MRFDPAGSGLSLIGVFGGLLLAISGCSDAVEATSSNPDASDLGMTSEVDADQSVDAQPVDIPSDDVVPETDYTTFVTDFMVTYCTSCHNPGGMARGVDLTSYESVVQHAPTIRCGVSATQLADCAIREPYSPRFPIGNGPVPEDVERDRLVQWIDDGMLE